ncbi:MAG: sodium:solute symporter family protein [Candidatus Marinimicrobia bacterium]|nr:sodium:solute symporter family protein [Candidatus Neomarinimicrobiota bacterium]
MHWIDYFIFALYMTAVLGIGVYHFKRNKHSEDYYVGNRNLKATHVGLSIVATDVGGGFSIGLGGVGFLMGLSGSWLLFTGLVGAWLSAVFIIPRIKKIDVKYGMMTYPDFLRFRYNNKVALIAAIISGIGYMGFTGAQILAGAKLASVTIFQQAPWGMDPLMFSILLIAFITVSYTVIGGLKAVIYTDTIQWIVLLTGLIAVTIPFTLVKIGGFQALRVNLPPEFFTLNNIGWKQVINWMVTIIPIWLIGMTLYQRMYACKNEKEAKNAWYIAGIFEYPIMAFAGVFLGMCARVVFPLAEAEMAMPMLISHVLPIGVTGIVIAAYFSAIMSTADSCLMASSGNVVNDIIQRHIKKDMNEKTSMRWSMIATLVIGVLAVALAAMFQTVLDAILYAYAFMVSGLFIPTLGAYFWKKGSSTGAFLGMIFGGGFTLILMILQKSGHTPQWFTSIGLDAAIYGILLSLITFITGSLLFPRKSTK